MLSEIIAPDDRASLQKGDETLFKRLLYENLKKGRSRGHKLTAVRSRDNLDEKSPAVEENQQSPAAG